MKDTKRKFGKIDIASGLIIRFFFKEGETDPDMVYERLPDDFVEEYLGKEFEAVYRMIIQIMCIPYCI